MDGRTDRQLLKDLSFKTPCIVVYSSHSHICWMWVMCGSSSVKTTTKWNSSDEAQHTNKKNKATQKSIHFATKLNIGTRAFWAAKSWSATPVSQSASHPANQPYLLWQATGGTSAAMAETTLVRCKYPADKQPDRQTDGLEDRHLVQQLCNSHKGFRKRNKNKRKRLC